VIFGKERPADLRGVFSSATFFWSDLPSECSKNRYLNCGVADLVLPKGLLELFGIKTNTQMKRRLKLSVYSLNDGHNRGMARVFAEVDGATAIFQITSTGGEVHDAKRLVVRRDFPDGTGDTIQVREGKKDGFVIKALDELTAIRRKVLKETDKELECGSCPAKINGLPGTIV